VQAAPEAEDIRRWTCKTAASSLSPAQKTQPQAIDKREFSNLDRHCTCRDGSGLGRYR
jgi:hypothetical protein